MTLRLLEGIGIELEYMIVDARTLDVRPISDELLRAACGAYEMSVERGPIAWSNELALHVIEMKTNGPVPRLSAEVSAAFAREAEAMHALLAPLGARLLPTAMHPWMDPHREMRLWPHEDDEIYRAFDRIFDCRGHGWANLQSAHINLAFDGDQEFGRLHAAVRAVLPLLPALAASSPVVDGRVTGILDNRLAVYRDNARRVPSVAGRVIPEPVWTHDDYQKQILQRIYADMRGFDPDGLLAHEWVNSRGAIARFDRGAIEIRVLDVQECPAADLGVCIAIVALVRALVEERWADLRALQALDQDMLVTMFERAVATADEAVIDDASYLRVLGLGTPATAREVWAAVAPQVCEVVPASVQRFLERGPLARRLLAALGPGPDRARIQAVYAQLADCIRDDRLFD